jgi:hypothetical protein
MRNGNGAPCAITGRWFDNIESAKGWGRRQVVETVVIEVLNGDGSTWYLATFKSYADRLGIDVSKSVNVKKLSGLSIV